MQRTWRQRYERRPRAVKVYPRRLERERGDPAFRHAFFIYTDGTRYSWDICRMDDGTFAELWCGNARWPLSFEEGVHLANCEACLRRYAEHHSAVSRRT
jgi:hypothetical protein